MSLINLLKPLLNGFLSLKFNYSVDMSEFANEEPFVVLSSHSTRLDFLFLIDAFKKYDLKTLVQSHNFAVKGLRYFTKVSGSITKKKVNGDFLAMKLLKKEVDKKNNVLIFPTGMSSHCGDSFDVPQNVGKLVKLLNCNIVTCRIDGGYFAIPPFGAKPKKGSVKLTIKTIIKKEEISSLSNEEIYNKVNNQIFFDDIEKQRIEKKHLGKKRLGILENILWQCPHCRQEFAIKSDLKENTLECLKCNYKVSFNNYGFFESLNEKKVVFDNIRDWYKFQLKNIADLKQGTQDILFSIDVTRRKINLKKAKSYKMTDGTLTYSKDKGLVFKNDLEEICYLKPNCKNITQLMFKELYVVENDYEILFKPKECNKVLKMFWLCRL